MDGGMEERGQEMSLERGSRNGRQGDRQRGQLIPRPGGRVDRARVRAGRAAAVRWPGKWVGWGAKPGPCSRDWPHGDQSWTRVPSRAPRPPPGSGSLPLALGLGPGFTLSWGPAGDGDDLTGARNRKQPKAKV